MEFMQLWNDNEHFITYEEPYKGKLFTKKELQQVYSADVDKNEYPEFDVWIYDMLKSGVFVRKEK